MHYDVIHRHDTRGAWCFWGFCNMCLLSGYSHKVETVVVLDYLINIEQRMLLYVETHKTS